MAPSTRPKKPSQDEYTKMITGPRVDVYVGLEKKHYCLPKLLLCHYSDYFDKCFNGKFVEGETQQLYLPEDKIENWSVILEYMLHGVMPPPLETVAGAKIVASCMDFLKYIDKYNLGVVGEVLCPILLSQTTQIEPGSGRGRRPRRGVIEPSSAELIFRVSPEGSKLREIAAKYAISAYGINECLLVFRDQLLTTQGFSVAILQHIAGLGLPI